jgi:murein DD-endopeptidase MepM/ murein hydrolase activator NlpD
MAKRLLLLLALAGVIATPALAGDDLGDQKAKVDAKLANVQAKIARQKATASHLQSQIGSLTSQIKDLQERVGDVSTRLSALQEDLVLHQRRLDKLNELFKLQTVRLNTLKHQYKLALRRLNLRLVDLYKQNEPTTVDVVLAARSFQDVLDQLDYLGAVATQDKNVAAKVRTAKHQVKVARRQTASVRTGVRQEAQVISARAQQAAILRGELLTTKGQLASTRQDKSRTLVITKKQVQDEIDESQALSSASASLAAKLRARSDVPSSSSSSGSGSSAPSSAPSSSGLIWPVSAPITSPFGMRWGTLHPGLDLGAPYGSAIHAAASGTVVWCGWMSGYGNLVMIDHGGGIATAYGHQSRIAVSCNQQVSQGQVIGYVGSTGYSTGPHLHFEVRLNGTPVDPLGYLP